MENLAQYIMKETEFLNFKDMYNDETKAIIEYFLNKNINCLFGKTEFTINKEKNSEIMIDKVIDKKNSNKLNIDFNGYQFFVEYHQGSEINELCISDYHSPHCRGRITFNFNNNTYFNDIEYLKDETIVKENQKIDITSPKSFEYQKEVLVNDEYIKYPKYMMVPAGVKNNPDKELFNIIEPETPENKNDRFLKKIIYEVKNPSMVAIKTNYGDYNVLNYVSNIFEVMETKTSEYEQSKKL